MSKFRVYKIGNSVTHFEKENDGWRCTHGDWWAKEIKGTANLKVSEQHIIKFDTFRDTRFKTLEGYTREHS